MTAAARTACEELAAADPARSPSSELVAEPDATLLAFGADGRARSSTCSRSPTRCGAAGGTSIEQGPPPSLHCTVNAVHDGKIDAFVDDLRASLDEVVQARDAVHRALTEPSSR